MIWLRQTSCPKKDYNFFHFHLFFTVTLKTLCIYIACPLKAMTFIVKTYFIYLPLSMFISGAVCLYFPVPGSMAIVMNSSAISRSSPVYVWATSSSVTGLCGSTGCEELILFLFFVPWRPLWPMLRSRMRRAPSMLLPRAVAGLDIMYRRGTSGFRNGAFGKW